MQFYEKYLLLCYKSKKSPAEAAQEMGFSRMSSNRWKNGVVPKDNNLKTIADYFGVTVEYLKGETDDPTPDKKSPAEQGEALSEAHIKLMNMAKGVNGEDLEKVLPIIQAAIDAAKGGSK